MMLDNHQAEVILIAGLGIKAVVMTLMTVRCRIVSGQMRPIPEDNSAVLAFLINWIFKPLLLVCPIGPDKPRAEGMLPLGEHTASDPSLLAWLGAHRNATEQEPWFVAMVIAFGLQKGSTPQWLLDAAPVFAYAYLAARVLHMLSFALGLQPWRTLTFVAGLFTQLIFGVLMLAFRHEALCILAAGLGVKAVVMTLMTVRCRIVSGEMRPIPEDNSAVLAFLINWIFKPLLLVCPIGPAKEGAPKPKAAGGVESDPHLLAWLGAHRNSTEQEPWFLALALAAAVPTPGRLIPPFSYLAFVYLAARVLHMLSYVFGLQPWRTLTFVTGLFAQLIFAVLVILSVCCVSEAGILATGLAVKEVVMTLMTVRCRIVSGQMRPIPEDNSAVLACLINYVFKVLLVICPIGPDTKSPPPDPAEGDTDPFLLAWLGAHRNATEQEPWFLTMAVIAMSLWTKIYSKYMFLFWILFCIYGWARFLHLLSFVLHLQPWRTLTFVTGLFTQLILGVMMLYGLFN